MEVPDVEEEEPEQEDEEVIHETMFTFDAFEKVRSWILCECAAYSTTLSVS